MPFSGLSDRGPISAVREGMQVFDARGEEVGKVDAVQMGDSAAVTDRGEPEVQPQAVLEALLPTGNRLPEQAREKLARTGYVRIDRRGVFSGSCYVGPDEIARVETDTVHLTKNQDVLLTS